MKAQCRMRAATGQWWRVLHPAPAPGYVVRMRYALLADATVLLHGLFVVFVVTGGLLCLRWPRAAWVHLPLAAWGAWVELGNRVCPLTPLENFFRSRAGEAGYEGGFLEHYVLGLLYPEGLTRSIQLILGVGVIAVNVAIYLWVFRWRPRREEV